MTARGVNRREHGDSFIEPGQGEPGVHEQLQPVGNTQNIAVSADMRRLVLLAGGVARVYDLSVSRDYAKMSLPQLKAEACHALRNQSELRQVSGICQ